MRILDIVKPRISTYLLSLVYCISNPINSLTNCFYYLYTHSISKVAQCIFLHLNI
nr:MAG TPA: hypothetical protein [Caudoviricetes sp.]